MKTKLKQAKNQALLDIKKQGLHYSEKEDYEVRKCVHGNPGISFKGVRIDK